MLFQFIRNNEITSKQSEPPSQPVPVAPIIPIVKKEKDVYRFCGERYSFKAVSARSPSDPIPQVPGLYAFPKGDEDPILSHDLLHDLLASNSSSTTI